MFERLFSVYLIGEIGPLRLLRGFAKGVVALIMLALLLLAGIGVTVAVLSHFPDVARLLVGIAIQIVVLIVAVRVCWSVFRRIFRW